MFIKYKFVRSRLFSFHFIFVRSTTQYAIIQSIPGIISLFKAAQSRTHTYHGEQQQHQQKCRAKRRRLNAAMGE